MKDLYLFSCKREILARKLETLPITIPLKPIRPETALRRALSLNLDQKRYTFEESSFEKVNDKPVQIILSREALSNGDIDAGVGKAYVERGRIEVNTIYPEIRASSRKRLSVSHGDSHHQGPLDRCHKVSDCLHGNPGTAQERRDLFCP